MQCYVLLLTEYKQEFPHQILTELSVDKLSTNRAYTKTRQVETRQVSVGSQCLPRYHI